MTDRELRKLVDREYAIRGRERAGLSRPRLAQEFHAMAQQCLGADREMLLRASVAACGETWHESTLQARESVREAYARARDALCKLDEQGERPSERERTKLIQLRTLAQDATQSRRNAELDLDSVWRTRQPATVSGGPQAVSIAGNAKGNQEACAALGCVKRNLLGPTERELLNAEVDRAVEGLDPFQIELRPARRRKTRRGRRAGRKHSG